MVLILLNLLLSSTWASCLYSPPFAAGKSHRIIQGPHGSYSHKPPLQYGMDFEMPIGTLIYSSRGGTVVHSSDSSQEGGPSKAYIEKSNKIIIDHGDGTRALYAHLKFNSSRVKKGQVIKRGMPIGRSGCTGWCDGPHLHFEVFKKDTKQKRKRKSIPVQFKTKLGCTVPKFGSNITNQFTKSP